MSLKYLLKYWRNPSSLDSSDRKRHLKLNAAPVNSYKSEWQEFCHILSHLFSLAQVAYWTYELYMYLWWVNEVNLFQPWQSLTIPYDQRHVCPAMDLQSVCLYVGIYAHILTISKYTWLNTITVVKLCIFHTVEYSTLKTCLLVLHPSF